MKIAVTSTNGRDIDQHFGRAERFLIYDYAAGTSQPVEIVTVEKYCSAAPHHDFDHTRFKAVVDLLTDCKALVTEMIGERPRLELEKTGIIPVIAAGAIAAALQRAHDSVCSDSGCKSTAEKRCPHH